MRARIFGAASESECATNLKKNGSAGGNSRSNSAHTGMLLCSYTSSSLAIAFPWSVKELRAPSPLLEAMRGTAPPHTQGAAGRK